MNTVSPSNAVIVRAPSNFKVMQRVRTEAAPDRFESACDALDEGSRLYTKIASWVGGATVGGSIGAKAGLATAAFVGGAAAVAGVPGLVLAGGLGLAGLAAGTYIGHKVSDTLGSEFGKLGEKAANKLNISSRLGKTAMKATGALGLLAAAGLSAPLAAAVMGGVGLLGAAFAEGETTETLVEVKDQAKRQATYDSLNQEIRDILPQSESVEVHIG